MQIDVVQSSGEGKKRGEWVAHYHQLLFKYLCQSFDRSPASYNSIFGLKFIFEKKSGKCKFVARRWLLVNRLLLVEEI